MVNTKHSGLMWSAFILAVLLVTGTAAAQVPLTQIFDLTQGSSPLFAPREKKLADTRTPPQSFGFDNVNHFVYVAQVTGPTGSNDYLGNLTITKLDLYGNIYGSMLLKNFGHGVSIGVEPSDSKDAWLWVEVDPLPELTDGTVFNNYKNNCEKVKNTDDKCEDAYGTKLARIRFADRNWLSGGEPLDSRDKGHDMFIERFSLIEGATKTTCSIDWENKYLLMRYNLGGSFRYALFDLDKVNDKSIVHPQPLVDIPQPPPVVWKQHTWVRDSIPPWVTDLHTLFQGYASFGSYLYLLEGEKYSEKIKVYSEIPGTTTKVQDTETNLPDGNTWLTVVDLNSGAVVGRVLTRAGGTIKRREPEGMAIQTWVLAGDNKSYVMKPRLCFGFSSETPPTSGSDQTRKGGKILQTAIYYKDDLADAPWNSLAEEERCREVYSRWWKKYILICGKRQR